MNDYKVEEGRLTKGQLSSLHTYVQGLVWAIKALEEFADREDCGMSEDFCNAYPFTESLDEVRYKSFVWLMGVGGRFLDAEQTERDYYFGTKEVTE